MSKYDGLGDYLRKQPFDEVPMTFSEIEKVTGAKLPPTAQQYRSWWSNSPWNSVMTKVWLDAGFRSAQVDVDGRKLVFKRAAYGKPSMSPHAGLADAPREFTPAENVMEKKIGRHPLIGSMKGTFTIEPGYDLTSPMYTDAEWAEVEKLMEEDWDQIDQGMSGNKK